MLFVSSEQDSVSVLQGLVLLGREVTRQTQTFSVLRNAMKKVKFNNKDGFARALVVRGHVY